MYNPRKFDFKWHGWFRKNVNPVEPPFEIGLCIGPVPGRKAIALHSVMGGTSRVHAYFRTPEEAKLATKILDFILTGDTDSSGFWRQEWIDE